MKNNAIDQQYGFWGPSKFCQSFDSWKFRQKMFITLVIGNNFETCLDDQLDFVSGHRMNQVDVPAQNSCRGAAEVTLQGVYLENGLV